MSKRVLAVLFGTPINLSNNLPSNLGDIYSTSPALTLGIFHILGDVNLGSEECGLDQEVSLESWVHDGHSGGVGGQPNETKGGINRGVRETDVERRVAGEGVDGEFSTREVFCGSEEGDITVDGTVRGFDEELGKISELISFVTRHFLAGVIREGDVDGDGRVPGFEDQEFGSGEVSNDDIILGPKVTTINAQSLWIRMVSQHVIRSWGEYQTSALIGRNKVATPKSLNRRSASSNR